MRTLADIDADIAVLKAERRRAIGTPAIGRQNEIAADYAANMPVPEIATKYGIGCWYVYTIMSRLGIRRNFRRKLMSAEQLRIYNKMRYRHGFSRPEALAEAMAAA